MITQLPFSPLYDYYACNDLTYDGHDYREGDPFPKVGDDGKKPIVNPRLLRQLYEQRRISAVPPIKAPLPPAEAQPAAPGDTKPPEGDGVNLGDKPRERTLAIRHKGFGKWWVVDADTNGSLAGPYQSAEEAHLQNPQVPPTKKE